MTNNFNRLASHFGNYWKDKGVNAPEINFDVKAIERFAEEKAKEELGIGDLKSKPESKPEASKPKEKDLGISSQLSDLDNTIEKAIENKVKSIIGRLIDDKIRNAMSKNLTNFEQAIALKIESKVKDLKPRVLNDLKTVAPDVEKDDDSNKKPSSFTDSAFMDKKEDKDILEEKASCEVFPGIFVKAVSNDKGEIFVKEADKLVKMNYTVTLPKVASINEYRKQLRTNIESLVK